MFRFGWYNLKTVLHELQKIKTQSSKNGIPKTEFHKYFKALEEVHYISRTKLILMIKYLSFKKITNFCYLYIILCKEIGKFHWFKSKGKFKDLFVNHRFVKWDIIYSSKCLLFEIVGIMKFNSDNCVLILCNFSRL